MSTPTVTPVSYDVAGAAAATGLSESEIRRAVSRGDLTPRHRGRKPLILRSDLLEWIESLPTTKKSGDDL